MGLEEIVKSVSFNTDLGLSKAEIGQVPLSAAFLRGLPGKTERLVSR